jgi:hypothetical protein
MTKTTKTQTTAQKVKAAIKAAGIPTKHISVTTSYPGYEEVITVTIKDTNINIDDVEKIARRFREVAIDERCQEILQGGNTFVHVRYDYAAEDEAINAIYNNLAIYAARQCVSLSDTVNINIIPNNGKRFLIVADPRTLSIIDNTDPEKIHRPHKCYNADNDAERTAYHIARAVFDLGGRFVNQIPDPSNDFYVIEKMGKGYSVAASCPGVQAAENCAKDCVMYDRRLDPEFNPVYFVCTASEVLAMADKTGIHYPKNRPQPTPESVKALIKEFNALSKAS